MKHLYVNIGSDPEDIIIIYITEDQAIQASLRKPNSKVEIFEKTFDFNGNFNGYLATSNYYKNGILHSK
jgi:hypothetical protein